MKLFKHLKPGISFLEVVAAIAILAIFGSSLFMMQTYIFQKIAVSGKDFVIYSRLVDQVVGYRTNILEEFFIFKGPLEKSLQEKNQQYFNPEVLVTTKTISDLQETVFKDFKDLYLLETQAKQDDKVYRTLYTFMHIPKVS